MALTVPTARVDVVISKDEQLRIFKPFNFLSDNSNPRHLKHYLLLFSHLVLFEYGGGGGLVRGSIYVNKYFSKCSFPQYCSRMSYLT